MTLSSSPIYAVRLVDVRSSCMIHLGGVAGVMYFVTSLKFGRCSFIVYDSPWRGGWGDVFCDFSKVWRCMARWEVDSVHGSVDGVRLGWKYLCCIFCLL
jgi:hypothetical protein